MKNIIEKLIIAVITAILVLLFMSGCFPWSIAVESSTGAQKTAEQTEELASNELDIHSGRSESSRWF